MSWSYFEIPVGSLLTTTMFSWLASESGSNIADFKTGTPVITLDDGSHSERNGYVVKVLSPLGVGYVSGNSLAPSWPAFIE